MGKGILVYKILLSSTVAKVPGKLVSVQRRSGVSKGYRNRGTFIQGIFLKGKTGNYPRMCHNILCGGSRTTVAIENHEFYLVGFIGSCTVLKQVRMHRIGGRRGIPITVIPDVTQVVSGRTVGKLRNFRITNHIAIRYGKLGHYRRINGNLAAHGVATLGMVFVQCLHPDGIGRRLIGIGIGVGKYFIEIARHSIERFAVIAKIPLVQRSVHRIVIEEHIYRMTLAVLYKGKASFHFRINGNLGGGAGTASGRIGGSKGNGINFIGRRCIAKAVFHGGSRAGRCRTIAKVPKVGELVIGSVTAQGGI